jgi:predicted ABC-type ATPase
MATQAIHVYDCMLYKKKLFCIWQGELKISRLEARIACGGHVY